MRILSTFCVSVKPGPAVPMWVALVIAWAAAAGPAAAADEVFLWDLTPEQRTLRLELIGFGERAAKSLGLAMNKDPSHMPGVYMGREEMRLFTPVKGGRLAFAENVWVTVLEREEPPDKALFLRAQQLGDHQVHSGTLQDDINLFGGRAELHCGPVRVYVGTAMTGAGIGDLTAEQTAAIRREMVAQLPGLEQEAMRRVGQVHRMLLEEGLCAARQMPVKVTAEIPMQDQPAANGSKRQVPAFPLRVRVQVSERMAGGGYQPIRIKAVPLVVVMNSPDRGSYLACFHKTWPEVLGPHYHERTAYFDSGEDEKPLVTDDKGFAEIPLTRLGSRQLFGAGVQFMPEPGRWELDLAALGELLISERDALPATAGVRVLAAPRLAGKPLDSAEHRQLAMYSAMSDWQPVRVERIADVVLAGTMTLTGLGIPPRPKGLAPRVRTLHDTMWRTIVDVPHPVLPNDEIDLGDGDRTDLRWITGTRVKFVANPAYTGPPAIRVSYWVSPTQPVDWVDRANYMHEGWKYHKQIRATLSAVEWWLPNIVVKGVRSQFWNTVIKEGLKYKDTTFTHRIVTSAIDVGAGEVAKALSGEPPVITTVVESGVLYDFTGDRRRVFMLEGKLRVLRPGGGGSGDPLATLTGGQLVELDDQLRPVATPRAFAERELPDGFAAILRASQAQDAADAQVAGGQGSGSSRGATVIGAFGATPGSPAAKPPAERLGLGIALVVAAIVITLGVVIAVWRRSHRRAGVA